MKLSKMGKKCESKDLICRIVCEIVKNRVGHGFVFHKILSARYTF